MRLFDDLNARTDAEAFSALQRCCGASRWVQLMLDARPFASDEAVFEAAEDCWAKMARNDILEAFSHHPKIGANIETLRAKFQQTAGWSASEQASVSQASDAVLEALAQGNIDYEAKFGYIFIVCATGKSAAEMLSLLQARLVNAPADEIKLAAAEQAKITRIRLEKLS